MKSHMSRDNGLTANMQLRRPDPLRSHLLCTRRFSIMKMFIASMSHAQRGIVMRNFGLGAFATDQNEGEKKDTPDYKQLFQPSTEGQYVPTTIYLSTDSLQCSITETARLVREPDYESLFRQLQGGNAKL